MKEEKCGTCKHGEEWITKKDAKNPGMGGNPTGFVLCEFRPRPWVTYYAGRLPCQFTPSRHERRADQPEGASQSESHGA